MLGLKRAALKESVVPSYEQALAQRTWAAVALFDYIYVHTPPLSLLVGIKKAEPLICSSQPSFDVIGGDFLTKVI